MLIANFDVVPQTRTITFQSTGTWYSFLGNGTGSGLNGGEGAAATVSTATQSITLQPGEYHVYTDRQVHIPKCPVKASSTAGTISCYGGTTTVTVTATGGTAPYTGTGTFTKGAGTYTFTVTDATGGTASTSVTLTQPATALAASVGDVYAVNPGGNANTIYLGYGPSSLTFTAAVSGGTAPYQYAWTEPAVSNSIKLSTTRSVTVSPSVAGTHTYKCTVIDSKGCSKDVFKTVTVTDIRCGNNQVTVCTNGKSKCVATNGVASLLKNGSYLGSCTGASPQSSAFVTAGANGASSITVYPNPSTGLFTLQLKNVQADKAQVTILDMKGMAISTRTVEGLQRIQNISFDLSNLASGTYMIKLVTKEGVQTTPVIISR